MDDSTIIRLSELQERGTLKPVAFGKPALMTAAWTDPVGFVRVVASLIPRELEATITPVTERMSDAQLEAIIARGIEGDLDPAATDEDAQIIQ